MKIVSGFFGLALFFSGALFAQNFRIDAIRVAEQTPCRVRFQVKYYISPAVTQACYIGAYIPNQASMASFALNPAGRSPSGVPKGEQNFSATIYFEMNWTGLEPRATNTIEVVIYDSSGNLCSRIFNFAKNWKRFDIQGIKRIYTEPNLVKFQVQYFIDPDYSPACYIGAYVPNSQTPSSAFGYKPAGRSPNGVPKGQKYFNDNIVVELKYVGANPYTSATLDVVIYKEGARLLSQTINWGQTWHR